jgi:hypothetical protein
VGNFLVFLGGLKCYVFFAGFQALPLYQKLVLRKNSPLCLNRKMVNGRLVLDAHAKSDASTYYLANIESKLRGEMSGRRKIHHVRLILSASGLSSMPNQDETQGRC